MPANAAADRAILLAFRPSSLRRPRDPVGVAARGRARDAGRARSAAAHAAPAARGGVAAAADPGDGAPGTGRARPGGDDRPGAVVGDRRAARWSAGSGGAAPRRHG